MTRLDTLLTSQNCDSGPNSVNSSTSSNSSTPSSILKTPEKESKKKSLRFREEKELQEVIGYGGEDNLDCSSSSEDEDVGETPLTSSKSKGTEEYTEELTVEEKNVLNLTRQNTTFNTHAQNLNTETSNGPPPLLRLGVDKKVTPIITVSVIFTRGFITLARVLFYLADDFFVQFLPMGKKLFIHVPFVPFSIIFDDDLIRDNAKQKVAIKM